MQLKSGSLNLQLLSSCLNHVTVDFEKPYRQAIAAIREESSPPERSIASGASDISLLTTESISFSCTKARSSQ